MKGVGACPAAAVAASQSEPTAGATFYALTRASTIVGGATAIAKPRTILHLGSKEVSCDAIDWRGQATHMRCARRADALRRADPKSRMNLMRTRGYPRQLPLARGLVSSSLWRSSIIDAIAARGLYFASRV